MSWFSLGYDAPNVGRVVRTRVMCQAGRERATGARGEHAAWLCECARTVVGSRVCVLMWEY